MEHIGESLAIGQPAHLATLSSPERIKVICETCKQEFDTFLYKGKPSYTLCQKCRAEEWRKQELQKVEAELPQATEEQRDLWFEKCGISCKFADKTFDNFAQRLQPLAFKVMSSYIYTSVLLLSPDLYGVGKTHLLAALAHKILNTQIPVVITEYNHIQLRSCPVLYTTETQLLARIRRTYDNRGVDSETEYDIYSELENIEHLLIDDVGKVRPRDYSFLQGVYFRIIDTRYTNEMPIVITTNLGFSDLEAHIGGACADRLREMCGQNIIKMAGKSYRAKEITHGKIQQR
uniref:Putative IstB domain protein ATP-binding protein n=1 Tax=viral metagenome TaxID=1070528 RepID=A0A6M3KH06_9ZZZZ